MSNYGRSPARWLLLLALGASACSDGTRTDDGAVTPDGSGSESSAPDGASTDGSAADSTFPDGATADGPLADGALPDATSTDVAGPDAPTCVPMSCTDGGCSLALDIDVPVATVSGRLTQGGMPWPTTSTSSGLNASATAGFFLRSQDTRVLHRIASISYGSTAPYTRPAGSEQYSSTVMPGAYELLYVRGESGGEVSRQFNSDPVLNADRVLRTVTINPGTQTLDIDIPVATVSGRLTLGGMSWPMTSTSSGLNASATAGFFLRSRDTQVLHRIASISYGSTAPYTRPAGSDMFSSTVMPGTYDLVYVRGESSGEVGRQFNSDPVLNADRVLRSVTINPGTQTLDIDIPVATVSGRLTLGGASWPMTSTSSGLNASATAGFFLRSQDTRVLHRIASISYGSTAPYTRPAGSELYSSTVVPGTYDLVYVRGESGGEVSRQFNSDPVLNADRVLRTVTINPGTQTIDIDVPVATVSGRLTLGGMSWPMTSTSSGLNASATAGFFLRSQDTRVLHRIASISYGSTAPYTRPAGSEQYSSTVMPGAYEVLYVRGESGGEVSRQFNSDPVLNADRVLRTVTINPGTQTLDVDVPVATVTGRLTLGGAAWPMTSTSSGLNASATAGFFLRSQDTRVLHRIASISYGSTAPYTRPAGSDMFSSTVMPGTYDLVYVRGESGGEVSRQFNSDPVLNADRVLRSVTINPGTQTLNIDVPVATVSGRLTQGGMPWPTTSTSSGLNASATAGFFLRSQDTRVLHRIASISYGSTAPYTRPAGSEQYSSTVMPGAYELLYVRGESSGEVGRQFNSDPVLNADRVLRSCVTVP